MAKFKDLTPKLATKLKTAEQEFQQEYQAGQLPFGQNLGGTQMYSNVFKRGYGDAVFGSSDLGIWLGAADFPNAPFSVDMDGNVIATSADFSGAGYTKLTIFKQDSIPVSVSVGDLWFDTDDNNRMYRSASVGADQITAGEWEEVAIPSVSIFAQDSIPTSLAEGDLWFDTDDDNKLYRAASVGADEITAGEWELVTPEGGITVFAQDSIPTSTAVGDLWYDTNDSNKPYRAASVGADQITAGEWEIVDDQRAADALLKSGSSQTLTGDIEVGSSKVKIDGVNTRITMEDDDDDTRFLAGDDGN